jgi:hypothetical protein
MKERVLFFWVASLAGAFLGGYFLNGRVPRYETLVGASKAYSESVPEIPHPTLAFLPSSGQPSVFVHDRSPADSSPSERIEVAREAAFQQQLLRALENAPECGGIGFIPDRGRAESADFYFRVDVYDRSAEGGSEVWGWLLYDRHASRHLIDMGSANLPETVARDICRNLWRQASPPHFEHPGIKTQ